METYFSILAWEIPWTEEPGELQTMRSQESNTTQKLNHYNTDLIKVGMWPVVVKVFSIPFPFLSFLKIK